MTTQGTGIPIKTQQELIRRILASRQFTHAESLQRILRYLFERTQDVRPGPVREQEIAIEALGRPADFDPRIDPIVRVSIASVRERLRQYFEQNGQYETTRLSLPKGQYKLQFETIPDAPSRAKAATEARSRFWAPYLSPTNPNIVVFTEVLFYRDNAGNYVRNIYVNDFGRGLDEIRARLPLPEGDWLPSFHFTPAGETNCVLSLVRTFAEIGASLDVRNARFFSWADARRSNLILLGSSRINPFVRSLQGDLPISITPVAIEDRGDGSAEPIVYTGQCFRDGGLERRVEYALVTRRPGPVGGTVVTIISANHGRAIEGAGTFLSDDPHLRGLEEAFGGHPPEHFQLLLRVEMLDYDEEVVDVRYVSHREIGASQPGS